MIDFSFLMVEFLSEPLWMWLTFLSLVIVLLILDLGVFHRKSHEIGFKESTSLSVFYISIGLLFGCWVWWQLGSAKGAEYFTGYILEKTLSMDNIFVIAVIFGYMGIPRLYQHRVLFWGIIGVIVLRGIMIGIGAALVHEFAWVLYIFAAFLIYTGFKMLVTEDSGEHDLSDNPVLKFMSARFRVTEKLHDQKFLVRIPHEGKGPPVWHMTPLLVTLVLIEISDVIFAVDSVPAVFSVTTDPFIVFTSNIFAILGLRALYFMLSALIERFVYLKYALSLVLVFIGAKVLIGDLTPIGKIPPTVSLGITLGILTGGLLASMWKASRQPAPSEAVIPVKAEKTETES